MATPNNRVFNTQTLYINALTLATVNDTTPTYPGQVGQVVSRNGCDYQYVQFKSTTSTIAAGTAVMWSDFDDYVVSGLVADAKRNYCAGVALGTVTAGNYGFIQISGPASVLFLQGSSRGGTDAAAGETAIFSATDGGVDRVAAGTAPTYLPVGVFTAASTGAAVASIFLTVPRNF